jgi:hypothetical protein
VQKMGAMDRTAATLEYSWVWRIRVSPQVISQAKTAGKR